MTIYFDINKSAYNTPIEGYIATCTDAQWAYYSQAQNMDKWDIIDCKFVDITDTPEYKAKELVRAKEAKLAEIKQKNKDKYSLEGQTITVELPATLKKGDEVKQVQNFKLLTITSAGQLATVVMGYTFMAQAGDIPDLLYTDDGYAIVGLNEVVGGQKFINLIFAKLSEAMSKITTYQRYLTAKLEQAKTIEEVQAIYVDFDKMPMPTVEEAVDETMEEPGE